MHTQVAALNERGDRVTLLEFARGEQAIADMDAMAKGGPDFDVREWRARANTVGSRTMLDSVGVHGHMMRVVLVALIVGVGIIGIRC